MFLMYSDGLAELLELNKNVPLFDDICKRSLKFIQSCMTSDKRVVNFIARYGVFCCLQCFDAVGWAAGRASGL